MKNASSISSPRHFPSSFSPPCWLLAILLLPIFLSGCASSPRPASEPVTKHPQEMTVLGVQYAVSTGAKAGHNTVEVYLWNGSSRTVTFNGGSLDGRDLPSLDRGVLDLVAKHFSFSLDGTQSSAVKAPLPPSDPHVTWWQFYPSATIPPGEAAICQVNVRGTAASGGTLTLQESGGAAHTVTIPRFRQPERRITAVTWNADGRTLFVQYDAGGASLERLDLGRQPLRSPAILRASHPGAAEVAVVPFPGKKPVRPGEPLLLELTFADGGVRRALVRPAPGILLDAPRRGDRDKTLPAAIRETYGFDADPAITVLPFDVACGDTRAGVFGAAAPAVCAARLAALRRDPGRLAGIEICTARYSAIWNIYAPLADALIVKPYQLHWGPNPSRFIENEDALIATAVAAAAPRPVVWVPERFKRERHLEGAELRLLAWTALARGVKGIRYHNWLNDADNPFSDCPGLGQAVQAVNADIRRLAPILGPLVPVGDRLDRAHQIQIYEGWSGDAGVLLLVRNLNYRTDAHANDDGRAPRFQATPARDVAVTFDIPAWLDPVGAADPLSNESYPHARKGDSLTITLPKLDEIRLIWLENRGRVTAGLTERNAP